MNQWFSLPRNAVLDGRRRHKKLGEVQRDPAELPWMCSTGLGLFTQGTSKENKVKVNTTRARHAQHSSHPAQSGSFPGEKERSSFLSHGWAAEPERDKENPAPGMD